MTDALQRFCLLRRQLVALSLVSHLFFVLLVVGLSWGPSRNLYLRPDSSTYVRPAHNLVNVGEFSRENEEPYVWEPYRLPGYPLLIAASLLVTGLEWPVLLFHPFAAALATYILVTAARRLSPSPRVPVIAGLLAALFPNSLGLAALLLTDALGGYLFVAAFVVSVFAVERASVRLLLVAGLFWMVSQALRPTLAIAAVLVIGIGIAFARSKRQWFMTACLAGITLPVPFVFCVQTYLVHGAFEPSLKGTDTLREYLMARVEASDNGEDYYKFREQLRHENRNEALRTQEPGETYYGRLYAIQQRQIKSLVSEIGHADIAKAFAVEGIKQALAPDEFLVVALTDRRPPVFRFAFIAFRATFLGMFVWGMVCYVRATGRFLVPGVFLIGFAFWIITGSISTGVGSRLRFPGDLILIPFAALGFSRTLNYARRFYQKSFDDSIIQVATVQQEGRSRGSDNQD